MAVLTLANDCLRRGRASALCKAIQRVGFPSDLVHLCACGSCCPVVWAFSSIADCSNMKGGGSASPPATFRHRVGEFIRVAVSPALRPVDLSAHARVGMKGDRVEADVPTTKRADSVPHDSVAI